MTTTNSLLIAGNPAGSGTAFASTCFHPVSGALSTNVSATEARIAATDQTALTIVNLGVLITTGNASTQTIRSRVATANGNQVISITGSATGWLSDSTHSDSVTAGQAYDTSWATGGNTATGTILLYAAQKTSPVVVWQGEGNSTLSFLTTAAYSYPFGTVDSQSGESVMQALVRAAGTWKSLQIGISGAVVGTVTIKSRKNTADGNQVLSGINPGANTTIQDTTHSDSVASGDLLAVSDVSTAASGTWNFLYSEFAGTISAHDLGTFSSGSSSLGTSLAASTSYYWPISGIMTANTTESKTQAVLPYALTASRLRSRIETNTSATVTIKSRKGGADGNQTISVASGSTGEVEDTTHSDSYVSTNTINVTGVTGTLTTLRVQNIRMLVDDGSVSASVAYTLTAAEGTYALTGKAAGTVYGPRVTAVQGSYTLTGEIANKKYSFASAKGTYTLTGKAAGVGRSLTLTAVEGTYALTGEDAGFSTGRRVTAAQGSYVLSGKDVHRGFTLISNFGSYHLFGQDFTGGRGIILRARHGKYHVRKQKTVLRYNNTSVTIWPVDSGEYVLDGRDLIFGQEVLRLTFSEFSNSTFLDWEQSDYTSYLDAAYVLPDGLNFTFVPYVYVFIEEGQTSDDVSLLMTVAKDWAETGNLPKLGQEIQVYRYRNGYLLSVSKNRVRGKGRAFQLQFVSETSKDFNLRGWGMWLEKNTRP